MTRLAKASSTFIFGRSASAGAGHDARSSATRGASSGDNGSGAPSHRRRPALALFALVALLALVVGATTAGAAKKTSLFVGSPTGASGTTGGLFNSPRGVAVNQAGTGGASAGDFYVVDGSNNRIQQFSASGGFIRAWGRDVVAKTVNEQQSVTVTATGGTYTLTFKNPSTAEEKTTGATGEGKLTANSTSVTEVSTATGTFVVGEAISGTGIKPNTTITAFNSGAGTITLSQAAEASVPGTKTPLAANLPFNASATVLQNVLRALPNIGASNATVTGGPGNATGSAPYIVTFVGTLATTNPVPMTSNATGLTPGGSTAVIATIADGTPTTTGDSNEKQTVTVGGGATGGSFKLTFGANTTAPITYPATAGEVKSALELIASVGAGNVEVTGSTGGPYTVEFIGAKASVDQAQMTADGSALTGGTPTITVATAQDGASFETCTVATQCKVGTTGGLGGAMNSPQGIAVNQTTGHVYVTDGGNLRVQEFTATGQFVRAWGGDVVQPGGTGETSVLVNERQTVTLSSFFGPIVGGTFTLTFNGQTTGAIPYNATASALEAELVALSNIGPGDVTVSGAKGGPWSVEFIGALAAADQPQMTGNPAGLDAGFGTGVGTEANVTTPQQGGPSPGAEICSIAQQCKAGIVLPVAGAFGSTAAAHPAVVPAGAPGAGNLLVPDPGNSRMQEFTASGVFDRAFGQDVTSGGTTGFEVCTVAANCKSGTSGVAVGQFNTSSPTHVAVDSTGKIYAIDLAPANGIDTRVETFDSSGGSPAIFATGHKSEAGGRFSGLAIGPNNHLFLLQQCPANPGTAFYESFCPGGTLNLGIRIYEYDAQGVQLEMHAADVGFTSSPALGSNESNGNLYFSTSGGTGGNRAWVMDDKGSQPPPILTINPPTEITEHSAAFTGTVNPNGLPSLASSYHFEYSKNGVTWTPVAADVNLGSGTSPISVPISPAEGLANKLEANTFYRVRILATRSFGAGATASPELTFLTDGVKPEVATFYPQAHSDTTARLTGSLNPNNVPTTYRFEYGTTTSYGSSAPVPDASATGGATRTVTSDIDGLTPATLYHYRLVATNAEGTSFGQDKAFTTYAADSGESARAFEMVTPPFKAIRTTVNFGAADGNSSNPGVPSIDGNSILWTTVLFPLTDDVNAPSNGDKRRIDRTPEGWTWHTLNTLPLKVKSAGETTDGNAVFSKQNVGATSADLKTQTWDITGQAELIQSPGPGNNLAYTRRDGIGIAGFTPFTTDNRQVFSPSSGVVVDASQLNDDGTAMVRWGGYAGLAEDPNTPGDDDPSNEQQTGGAVYRLKAASPDEMPGAPKDLVEECTGTGGEATLLPVRVGTGIATDTIGTQSCGEQGLAPQATGTGVRTGGSATLTSVTGTFAVGQFISGPGIPSGTKVTAVGAGTLTMSANASCGTAGGQAARVTAGTPILTGVVTTCGQFAAGQTITGTGIPGGTTIIEVSGPTDNKLTLSASVTASNSAVALTVAAPASTPLAGDVQHVTSVLGARAGSASNGVGPSIGSISDDGDRVFFTSPDFGGSVTTACTTATGGNTSCPPQLFVRQYDSTGNPTVRWISKPQGVGAQQIGEMGPALFQGASKDGRYVYFQTNSPLLPSDPNGGNSITTGTASNNSWDLYRYTLPSSLDTDPASGTLTRITGGPSGTADPGSNVSNGNGGALRYFSDDGKRAYFVTTSPIAGAENNPPNGGITSPSGTVANSTTRNLYLFDDTGVSPQWRFIAQIPYSEAGVPSDANSLKSCASSINYLGASQIEGYTHGRNQRTSCFRGTPDGKFVIFFTPAQLTADDTDTAGDIYAYDSQSDELIRISAGTSASTPYGCLSKQDEATGAEPSIAFCNADLGINSSGGGVFGNAAGTLDTARGWGGGRNYNIGVDTNGVVSVFFESESQLIPQDTNGDHMDVYQWRKGKLSLVSRGDTPNDSFYSGNGLNGRDVFMFTSDRIDPREIDDSDYDLYDARVGGGFPYTPPATPCDVLAEDCRNPAPPAPAGDRPATVGVNGSGNVSTPKCRKGQRLRKGKCVPVKHRPKKHKGEKKTHAAHVKGAK